METATIYGCLLVPHFPILLALRDHHALRDSAVAIGMPGQRGELIDCSPEARRLGISPGLLAREAQNLAPQLTILPADPLRYGREQRALIQSLYQVCPALQGRSLGQVYLDLRGLRRHYAGDEALGRSILASVDADLRPRLGIASSQFAAYVAARASRAGTIRIADEAQQSHLLARCPVALLPLSHTTIQRMERLGFHRLGDISALSLSSLIAQFGGDGKRVWHLARGEDPEPFAPDPIAEPIIEFLELPAASSLEGDLVAGLRIVTSRLLSRAELRNHTVRKLRFDLRLEPGSTVGRAVQIKEGTSSIQRLVSRLRAMLGSLAIDAPVTAIQIEVLATGETVSRQLTLGSDPRRTSDRLREVVAELAERYGTSPLAHVVEVNRWARLPEHRWALASFEV